jgi:predicted ester cyclase
MTTDTSLNLQGLLDLWGRAWTPGREAEEAFGEFYADPVNVNGTTLPLSALVERANALNKALADPQREILTTMSGEQGLAVEFRLTGRHVGPFSTSAGVLPATGRVLSLRVIDILTVTDGRVTNIAMVPDELAALAAADAVRLITPSTRER